MNNELINVVDEQIKEEIKKVDLIENYYSEKILKVFHEHRVSETDFYGSSGYGYNDVGRDKIDQIFADVLDAESGLVRSQFISGTHALTVTLFGLLRPGDTLLSISSKPYDTLDEVIGIIDNPSSLKAYGIHYQQIDLVNNDFDYDKIKDFITNNPVKVIEIQRSIGYSTRSSLTIDKIEKVARMIKEINHDIIIMVDNCYCEMVEEKTPTGVGCDIMVGSLIKNLGGGLAPNGAYVVGKKELVNLVAERLTVPGQGNEVGPSLGINKAFLQGLYMAPSVVASSVKTAIFTSCLLEKLGFNTEPKYNEKRADIVQKIIFKDANKLIKYVEGIQEYSAIDSNSRPIPTDMPGYSDPIIMASGSFTQGSSIEISCDGPIREPFIAYQQGSLTYQYGRLAVINAVKRFYEEN